MTTASGADALRRRVLPTRGGLILFLLLCLAGLPHRVGVQFKEVDEAARTAPVIVDGITLFAAWRKVRSIRVEAARRTAGLRAAPAPFVLQKRLGDFAPVYEINGYAAAAPATLSALIANIQDVFAERSVQIMTPNYVADPSVPKLPDRPADPMRAAE